MLKETGVYWPITLLAGNSSFGSWSDFLRHLIGQGQSCAISCLLNISPINTLFIWDVNKATITQIRKSKGHNVSFYHWSGWVSSVQISSSFYIRIKYLQLKAPQDVSEVLMSTAFFSLSSVSARDSWVKVAKVTPCLWRLERKQYYQGGRTPQNMNMTSLFFFHLSSCSSKKSCVGCYCHNSQIISSGKDDLGSALNLS